MRRTYRETLARHRLLYLPPLIALAIGIVLGLRTHVQYGAEAAIWADNPIPRASTVGTTGTDGGASPPSAGQLAMMRDYLASQTFLLQVARAHPVAGIPLDGNADAVDKGLAALAKSVSLSTPGPNILKVEVKQPKPADAQGLAKALVDTFLQQEKDILGKRGKAQVASSNKLVDNASQELAAAQVAQAQYLRDHPPQPGVVDPQAETLRSNVTHAQQAYDGAQKASQDAVANLPTVDDSSLFVMDEPTHAVSLGRRKALLLGGVGGLLAGLAITVLALVTLIKRDDVVRRGEDIVAELNLQVVGDVGDPSMPRRMSGRRRPAPDQQMVASVRDGRLPRAEGLE